MGRVEFQLYQNHSDIYEKKTYLPDTHFPSVAFIQQLVLGNLSKRDRNFIHIRYTPFPRVTVTQGKFFRNAGGKKKKATFAIRSQVAVLSVSSLMMTMGQSPLVFRQKIRPWHRVSSPYFKKSVLGFAV